MRAQYLRWIMCATLLVGIIDSSFAQNRPTKRRTTTNPPPSKYGNATQTQKAGTSKYGVTDTTTRPANTNAGSAYGDQGVKSAGIDTTLPIEVIKTSGNGLVDSAKMSLRNDAGVEQNLIKDKAPLAYEQIREDDAVYRVRVWREIDAREKMNLCFRYSAEQDNGNQRFISILLRAISSGELTAFSGEDDRFTTPITPEAALNAFGGGSDTVPRYDAEGNVVSYQVRPKAVDPDSIYKFQIKEEWIFDKESSRLYVRILGIAPVMPYYLSNGQPIPNSERPLWWVYYPDARPILAKIESFNPKNMSSHISWEDLFESRMFSSYIIKSTLDNPFDMPLSAVYPNNTLFRLLEGERIKDKIFNYEQSLWSY